MKDKERKESLRSQYVPPVDLLGYKFSSDDKLVNDLLEAEVELEKRFGAPYCPCQGRMQTGPRICRLPALASPITALITMT